MECLRAAIANGADAVYLGIGPFNARRRAENFTPDQLPELRDMTARCGVRLYAAMNTLLLPDELDAAAGLIERLAEGRRRRGYRPGRRPGRDGDGDGAVPAAACIG